MLERLQLLQVDAELRDDRLRVVVEAEVGQVVPQGAAHQELHGEVVEALGVLLAIAALALAHGIERRTPHGDGERLQPLARRRLLPNLAAPEAQERLDPLAEVDEAARRACRL